MNLDERRLGVTHLVAPARFGGLETVVATLSGAQARAGLEVRVVALIAPGEEDHPFLETLDRTVHATGLVVPPRRYLAERRRVLAELRVAGSQVLHTHGYRPDVVAGPSARRNGYATVTTVHGFTGGGFKNRLYEHLQRRAYRHFDAVVAVSEKLRAELSRTGIPGRRLHAVPNAWSGSGAALDGSLARSRLGLEPGSVTIGWIGRLTPEKGPDVMLRALRAIERPEVGLSVVGEGAMREDLAALARELGVEPRVRWHGMVPGAGALVSAFDALVLSSWTEGTPMVLLEAMSAGVPIVATAVGGVPDMIGEEEAILTPPGDAGALAEAVLRILADPETARARAAAAKIRLEERFSVERWAARYEEIYRSVLQAR